MECHLLRQYTHGRTEELAAELKDDRDGGSANINSQRGRCILREAKTARKMQRTRLLTELSSRSPVGSAASSRVRRVGMVFGKIFVGTHVRPI